MKIDAINELRQVEAKHRQFIESALSIMARNDTGNGEAHWALVGALDHAQEFARNVAQRADELDRARIPRSLPASRLLAVLDKVTGKRILPHRINWNTNPNSDRPGILGCPQAMLFAVGFSRWNNRVDSVTVSVGNRSFTIHRKAL